MKRILPYIIPIALIMSGCTLLGNSSEDGNVTETHPEPLVTTVSAPNPDDTARQYLDAWKMGDYGTMYGLLSPLSQDGMDLEMFVETYEEIERSGAVVGVDYQIVSSLVENPHEAEVRYRTALDSAVVGEFDRETSMNLKLIDDSWRVIWTESLILPGLTEGNRLRLQPVTLTRANVYDRNGLALAAQANAASLWITPNQIGDDDAEDAMLTQLRRLFDLPSTDEIVTRYDPFRGTDFVTPLGEVSLEDYQQVSEALSSTGGSLARTYSTRYYPGNGLTPYAGGTAPHSIGFVSWIREEDLEAYQALGYQGDEFVGQMGVEQSYEAELRGVPGGKLLLTDADGFDLEVFAQRDPQPPYAVYTTLDRDLQTVAQQAIENFNGAVVVLERDTGAVLAMASSPGFDPNLFDPENPNSSWGLGVLNEDPNLPFLNRATLGQYPPGSIFKIITMAAALESGIYEAESIYKCDHFWRELPGVELVDWTLAAGLGASGELSLKGGLQRSCNPWFYHIGLTLFSQEMPSAISDMAQGFGLGQKTGIEIDEEAGLVPSPENKLDLYGEEWKAIDPVQMAIGQSYLLVTPLQVARYVAAVGNGGTLFRPQLIQSIENAEGEVLQDFSPDPQGQLPVSEENLAAIQEAMVSVVADPRGTAYRKFLGANLNIAGKTGSATSGDVTESHAWFAGYTFEEREDLEDIVIVVLLEHQGEGSTWAAPVFRRVAEAYFKGRPISLYPWESRIRVERTPEPEEEVQSTPTPSP
ncbi:MAG: penicillin-binding transpeptidase domain-containing protein [Anaerolineales bacterium]